MLLEMKRRKLLPVIVQAAASKREATKGLPAGGGFRGSRFRVHGSGFTVQGFSTAEPWNREPHGHVPFQPLNP